MSRSRQQSLFDLPPEPPPEGSDADPAAAWQAAAQADRLAAQVGGTRALGAGGGGSAGAAGSGGAGGSDPANAADGAV